MKKNGIFVDPALGKDRFDFTVEPLTDEDVVAVKASFEETMIPNDQKEEQ